MKYWIVLLAFVATSPLAQAQWSGSIMNFSVYDNNLFRSATGGADFINTSQLSLEYIPESSDVRFSYTGSVNLFRTYDERLYQSHQLELLYAAPLDEDEVSLLYVGARYALRGNREEYEVYDFGQWNAFLNVKYYLADDLLGRAGYSLRYRSYPNIQPYSYLENYGFVHLAKFFDTGTSLFGEVGLGYKNYRQHVYRTSVTQPGMGAMMGRGRVSQSMTGVTSYEIPSAAQLVSLVRVAQSISTTTGISVQYLKRGDLLNRSDRVAGTSFEYTGDEELFDDPYGYQSDEISSTVTQLLPWEVRLRLAGEYHWKRYSSLAYDLEGNSLPTGERRSDVRMMAGVEVTKAFGDILGEGLTVSASYSYQKNSSNDAFYRFNSGQVTVGIAIMF